MFSFIDEELARLTARGLERALTRTVEGPQGPWVEMDGRPVLLLCSNDYLGLASRPEVVEAGIDAARRYGAGAGASRLVSGDMTPHGDLEERIRDFKGAESALLFNSGYNANLGAISTLADRSTEIFSDRLNHASIVDGCRLSRARVSRYPTGDMDALEGLLRRSAARRKLIVTDGVFSMDGTVAPMGGITELAERYGAMVYLDDAHATGVLGHTGRGTLEHLGVDAPEVIQMGTLGKAFGSFGAFVTGPEKVIRLLVSRARPFIFTTALPPAVCAAAAMAVEIAEREPGLRERVRENASRLRAGLRALGLDTLGSSTQIIPILAGEPARTVEISRRLFEAGVFIQSIRPPAVPEGTSRLRATVTAAHGPDDIDRALEAIGDAFEGAGPGAGPDAEDGSAP